ncbi:MAG TPA: hypothetical protein DCX07_09930 [Phycisphaerales bacterium]|nr:hypothetical protein [Phycisphaerales bacterium]
MRAQRQRIPAKLLAVLLLAGLTVVGPAAALAETAAQKVNRARSLLSKADTEAKGLDLVRKILGDPKMTVAQKQMVFDTVLSLYRRAGRNKELIDFAQQVRQAHAGDAAIRRMATLGLAESYALMQQRDQAIETLEQYAAESAVPKGAAAEALLQAAEHYNAARNYDKSLAACAKAVELGLPDDRAAKAMSMMQEFHWRAKDYTGCADVLIRLLDDRYLQHLPSQYRFSYAYRYAGCLVTLEKFKEAETFCESEIRRETEDALRQRWMLLLGDIQAKAKRYDEALRTYERMFTQCAGAADRWSDAQHRIVEVLMKKGDFAPAVDAARICLDTSDGGNALIGNIRLLAETLKNADGNVTRANAFLAFQKYGPAGPDGKAGTADDLTDPLASVPRATLPQREKAFAVARAEAGDDAMASRLRAQSYLYTGHSAEALQLYVDAFQRSDLYEWDRIGNEMIQTAVRAAQGHAHGLDRFYDFVNDGPDGPDGKAGTADDQKDPFEALGVRGSGLPETAALSKDDVEALREARRIFMESARDINESRDLRIGSLRAARRASVALNDWGDAQERQWTLQTFADTEDPYLTGDLGLNALLAAKDGQYHLGGVRRFWAELARLVRPEDAVQKKNFDGLRKHCTRATGRFERIQILPRDPKSSAKKNSRGDPDFRTLRDYPEPKTK